MTLRSESSGVTNVAGEHFVHTYYNPRPLSLQISKKNKLVSQRQFGPVPAAGEYLPPGVEGGRVGEEHDHVGLGEAEPAHAGGRVEVLGPGKDGPVDVVVGVVVLQLPDVLAEGGGRCMAVAEGVGVPVPV